jgi:hypothetical protein
MNVVRWGVSLQGGLEPENNDWLATLGTTVGCQWRTPRVTPFIEGGAQAGVIRRTAYAPMMEPRDVPTLLWMLGTEIGVDTRLYGKAAVTLSLGAQQSSFYYGAWNAEAQALDLAIRTDRSLVFKVGVGY